MSEKQNFEGKITSFQVGPDPEKDIVCVEDLLMKLAMSESVIVDMQRYIQAVEEHDGMRPDSITAPDGWALSGLSQNLYEVMYALKAGCWGFQAAHLH